MRRPAVEKNTRPRPWVSSVSTLWPTGVLTEAHEPSNATQMHLTSALEAVWGAGSWVYSEGHSSQSHPEATVGCGRTVRASLKPAGEG
jgi:hypothetical protein